jgi:hypothetical protein
LAVSPLTMHIRRLNTSDASAFQLLYLLGLREAPTAFGSSYAEEKDRPTTFVESQLEHLTQTLDLRNSDL